MKLKSFFVALAVMVGYAGFAAVAHAQADYPNHAVRIVVPFPAGGTSDLMGRMMGEVLSKELNQPFVVENKGGAGGAIGSEHVARAGADGYTLLLSGIGSNAIIHGLEPKPAYDSNTDFDHITQLAAGPNMLVVHPSFPAQNFKEFINWVKANPGKFDFGQVTASSGHLTTEYLKQVADLDMVGIPYRGGALALNDVLAGQIHGMFTNLDAALPHVQAGKVRALAVTSLERNALLPEVPTISESGYEGFSAVSWTGLSAPKGTPTAIVEKLYQAMSKGFADPAARKRLEALGLVVVVSTPQEFTKFVADENTRWAEVVQKGNLKFE